MAALGHIIHIPCFQWFSNWVARPQGGAVELQGRYPAPSNTDTFEAEEKKAIEGFVVPES